MCSFLCWMKRIGCLTQETSNPSRSCIPRSKSSVHKQSCLTATLEGHYRHVGVARTLSYRSIVWLTRARLFSAAIVADALVFGNPARSNHPTAFSGDSALSNLGRPQRYLEVLRLAPVANAPKCMKMTRKRCVARRREGRRS